MPLIIRPRGVVEAEVLHVLDGATLDEVAHQADAHDEAGLVTFEVGASWTHRRGRVTAYDVTVTLRLFLPVWTRLGDAKPWERREWNRFMAALRFHEGGHLHLARVYARRIHAALGQATPKTFDPVFQRELDILRRRQLAYDSANGHGTRQRTPFGSTVFHLDRGVPWQQRKPRLNLRSRRGSGAMA